MKRLISFLLAIALIMSITSVAFAQEGTDLPNQIDRSTVWSYLDDNTDPSGNLPTRDTTEQRGLPWILTTASGKPEGAVSGQKTAANMEALPLRSKDAKETIRTIRHIIFERR